MKKLLVQLIEFLLLFFDANDFNCLWFWSKPSALDNSRNRNQVALSSSNSQMQQGLCVMFACLQGLCNKDAASF